MKFNISIDIPDVMLSSEQEMYLAELNDKLMKFKDRLRNVGNVDALGSIHSQSFGFICESDYNKTDITIFRPYDLSKDDSIERNGILGDLISLVGYAVAAHSGEPLTAFPNIPIVPLFGEMFVDPNSEDKTPQSSYYIAQGINPFEHTMEDVPEDQQHVVLDFIVPKMDESLSTILPTVFDKNPKLTETDTTDVYLTEEWFSGEPKLVCSFNLYADSSEDAIEHSVKMGQAFIEELRDKLIERNESEGFQ